MNIRRLRYFVALAERLNFTAAARYLGIAQPPLSVQIRALEQEVGGALFHREQRKIRLTPLGLLLLEEAHDLIFRADSASERLRDAAEGRSGEIRIGYTQAALSEYITKKIRKFFRKNRGARLSIAKVPCGSRDTLHVDALILETSEPGAGALILERTRLEIAVPPKHRLSARTDVASADLLGESILMAPANQRTPLENHIFKLVDHQKLPLDIRPNFPDFVERLWLVSLGCGLAVCSSADRGTLDAIRIPLSDSPEFPTVCLPNPASRAPALPAFLEAIRE